MVNYAVPPEVLQPFLPAGTTLDPYEGNAFVSLVGFMFRNTRLFSVPIPLLGTFEEINLRFYVQRQESNQVKRGVVFINETVPHRLVAYVANRLYKEHYTAVKTRSSKTVGNSQQQISYEWRKNKQWNRIAINARTAAAPMPAGCMEEFIFEHYWGYTKIDAHTSEEYQVMHPRWEVYPVQSYQIDCHFSDMYGEAFSFLQQATPHSVFLAKGSEVAVNWKRNRFTS
jgi:uncharacterized protein YqjF (DUF2071 family)